MNGTRLRWETYREEVASVRPFGFTPERCVHTGPNESYSCPEFNWADLNDASVKTQLWSQHCATNQRRFRRDSRRTQLHALWALLPEGDIEQIQRIEETFHLACRRTHSLVNRRSVNCEDNNAWPTCCIPEYYKILHGLVGNPAWISGTGVHRCTTSTGNSST